MKFEEEHEELHVYSKRKDAINGSNLRIPNMKHHKFVRTKLQICMYMLDSTKDKLCYVKLKDRGASTCIEETSGGIKHNVCLLVK
ncbi:hypothetical protein DPMN_156812 [Dreissena polymorpha]|uniref:Uncharacterized protein n=1 Tax=Dreissena polymorpha TaxID=45954 RepID=A0A9D4FQI2_DREPO|nr:hypothetical protein DPMN_156812 [Dreissena polymorpha]